MKLDITFTTKDWLIIRFMILIFVTLVMIANYCVDVPDWQTVWMGIFMGMEARSLISDYSDYKYPKELKKDTSHNV